MHFIFTSNHCKTKTFYARNLFFFKSFVSLANTRMAVYEKYRQTNDLHYFGIHIDFTKYFILLLGLFLDDLHIGKGFGLNPSFQIVQHFACIWIKRKSISSLQIQLCCIIVSSCDSSI